MMQCAFLLNVMSTLESQQSRLLDWSYGSHVALRVTFVQQQAAVQPWGIIPMVL